MGSGDWFKTIINLKKAKENLSKPVKVSTNTEKSNGIKRRHRYHKESSKILNGPSQNHSNSGIPIEDLAAIRIQTTFRGYMARKTLRHLKSVVRLHALTSGHTVSKQASTTLSYLKSWSKIQAQIRARRINMVTENRIWQKKQENQLKLEAKLHELDVEWCGGSETMEEIIARIQQREEAAFKRERTMAYAFTHQWRANSCQNLQFAFNFSKGSNWGWSWKERWIAVRPWEIKVASHSLSPSKVAAAKQISDAGRKLNRSIVKIPMNHKFATNGKVPTHSTEPENLKRLSAKKLVFEDVKSKALNSSPKYAKSSLEGAVQG